MLTMLIDIAVRSVLLRAYARIGYDQSIDNNLALNNGILHDMRLLGKKLRGSDSDIRTSPLWAFLENQKSYEDAFERYRPVTLDMLTPTVIYESLLRKNTLLFNGWVVDVGRGREITDDYGMPAWEEVVIAESPQKSLTEFSGVNKNTAHKLYQHIIGRPYDQVCTLGNDPPHPAENIPWHTSDEEPCCRKEN